MTVLLDFGEQVKSPTWKQEEQLVHLCRAFAESVLVEDVHVYIDEEGFSAMAPTADDDLVGNSISIMLREECQTIQGGHLRIEQELYGDVDYGFDYFTMSLLHEIGHLKTMRYFDSSFLFGEVRRYAEKGGGLREYKLLPHEAAADKWSLLEFIPNHWEAVQEFDQQVLTLLQEIREEKG